MRETSEKLPDAYMLLAPEQAQLMAMLVHIIGARRYLEIGTYTGYSALAVALAMPPDAEIITFEINPSFANCAREHWVQAAVAEKIEVRIGPALTELCALAASHQTPFDMALIDADKENIGAYYEHCLALLRPGGLVLIDNTLWSGLVCDETKNDPETAAIRAFNRMVHSDARVDMAMLPIGDGLTIARKI